VAVTLVVVGAVAGGYAWAESRWPAVRSFATNDVLDVLGLLGPAAPAIAPSPETPEVELALPRRGEGAFARARSLQASGHLRDALTALDAVRITDVEYGDADRLRAEIQRQILSISSPTVPDRIP
jgi:hypothetical protein